MTVRMATVEYASGHKCVDNGMGDYTLFCPDHPALKYFVPFRLARTEVPQKACPLCLRLIGAIVQ